MKKVFCIIQACMFCIILDAQHAPVSTLGTVLGYDQEITVAITAQNFNNIASCNLQIFYDPEIAEALSVSRGPELSGIVNANLNTPGVIRMGWFAWAYGHTFPDHTVIFNITFSKVANGTTALEWNNDYSNRNWGDGNGLLLNDNPPEDFYFDGSLTFLSSQAPETTIASISACQGETFELPVTVKNFSHIGAFTLTLLHNADAVSYQSFTGNPGFPGFGINTDNPGEIIIQGQTDDIFGVSLEDYAVLFTLYLKALNTSTELTWAQGISFCKYKGLPPDYPILSHEPFNAYFNNAFLTLNLPPAISMQPVSTDSIRAGEGMAVFQVVAEGSQLSYQWQEFTTTWVNINDNELYQGTKTPHLSIVNPPVEMDGNRYRCIIAGICNPPAMTNGMAALNVISGTGISNPGKGNNLTVSAGPNPFSRQIIFDIQTPHKADLKIRIQNLLGQTIDEYKIQDISGRNHSFAYAPDKLSPGVYLATIILTTTNETITRTLKIIYENN